MSIKGSCQFVGLLSNTFFVKLNSVPQRGPLLAVRFIMSESTPVNKGMRLGVMTDSDNSIRYSLSGNMKLELKKKSIPDMLKLKDI